MTDEEIKEKAKKQLVVLEKYLQVLESSARVVKALKRHAVRNQLHKRAIYSRTALTGLDELLADLRGGRLMCMDVLGAKKVPIVIEKKLKLVVNNTGGK
jgi:hypothetical protein